MGYIIHNLDPQTWLIEEEAECNVYMYLLAGEKKAVLIDTGYGTIPLDEIVSSLTSLPVVVLCTHGHFDHIGGIGYFPTALMHRADRDLYHQHRLEVRKIAPNCIAPDSVEELDWFEGEITLDLGGRTLEVFQVSGHTQGCVAILDVERRQLFTGDTCCKAAILLNFDHSADLATFRNSIVSILDKQDRFDTTWPSHHSKPVDVEIPAQFLEASDLLLSGKAQGKEIPHPFGTAKMFAHKDICIMY